jgi:hypothetical protein
VRGIEDALGRWTAGCRLMRPGLLRCFGHRRLIVGVSLVNWLGLACFEFLIGHRCP